MTPDELKEMLAGSKGHFKLESGLHGDVWLDLDELFLRPGALMPSVRELAAKLARHRVEAVCGPMLGGAFLAQMVALELGAEFYFAERITHPEKGELFSVEYRLPDALGAKISGKRVAVVDDVINAGSAVRGTAADLEARGATVVAVGALLLVGDGGTRFATEKGVGLESVAELSSGLWLPSECPLCEAGVELVDVTV